MLLDSPFCSTVTETVFWGVVLKLLGRLDAGWLFEMGNEVLLVFVRRLDPKLKDLTPLH